MNHSNSILSNIATLRIAKNQKDIRGADFSSCFKKIQKLFTERFKNQAQALLSYIDDHPEIAPAQVIEKSLWQNVLDWWSDDDEFEIALKDLLKDSYNVGTNAQQKDLIGEIWVSVDVWSKYADEYAEKRAGELITRIDETTREEVRDLFANSWKSGDPIATIKEKIEEKFSQFGSYRAALIAQQETSHAYEYGKSDQFDAYARFMRTTGWKKSKTQHDSNVRYTHSLNEIDGWIPNDQAFSGTGTMMAPHGFNCRCVTVRKIMPPSADDILDAQFGKSRNLENMADDEKKIIANEMQALRRWFPWVPQPTHLEWFSNPKNALMYYLPKNNSFGINPEAMSMNSAATATDASWSISEGIIDPQKRFRATIAHEFWHILSTNIKRKATENPTEKINGIPWARLNSLRQKVTSNMLDKMERWDIVFSEYPLTESTRSRRMEEVWAESVSAYYMGQWSLIDRDMKDFLDLLFTIH